MAFPTSPSIGTTHVTPSGTTYTYNSIGAWQKTTNQVPTSVNLYPIGSMITATDFSNTFGGGGLNFGDICGGYALSIATPDETNFNTAVHPPGSWMNRSLSPISAGTSFAAGSGSVAGVTALYIRVA